MFAAKRSSIRQSRHSRRDAAVDRQKMELPIPLPADHPLQLGIFTSALLGTFESALTVNFLQQVVQQCFVAACIKLCLQPAEVCKVLEILIADRRSEEPPCRGTGRQEV